VTWIFSSRPNLDARGRVTISITAEAYEAIKATLPEGDVAQPPQRLTSGVASGSLSIVRPLTA
jgi:hypothetical protein